jgi:hypothetical protein
VKGTFSLKGNTFVYVLSSDWLNYWFDTSTNQSISIMFSIVVLIDRNGNANHFSYEELGNNCI